jgi:hypothetical protein
VCSLDRVADLKQIVERLKEEKRDDVL